MSKYFNFKSIVFFLFVVFCISSCSSNDNTEESITDSAASTATAPSTNPAVVQDAKAAAFPETLDVLWTDASEFTSRRDDKKIVFSFTFRDPNILTLLGWQCPDDNCTNRFPDYPVITMKKANIDTLKRGPNVIFGNIVIFRKGNGIEKIKSKINTGKFEYVVFVPKMDGEFIKYQIYVTHIKPGVVKVLALEPTGIETNPSPPKNNLP